jgi:hypothetical protein
MVATWGFFVKLHPFYYFAMSYGFWFFVSNFLVFFSPRRKAIQNYVHMQK